MPDCRALKVNKTILNINERFEVEVDAYDPDGSVIGYQYDFNDGTITDEVSSRTYSHYYNRAGRFTLEVGVKDNQGYWATSNACNLPIDIISGQVLGAATTGKGGIGASEQPRAGVDSFITLGMFLPGIAGMILKLKRG